MTVKEIIQMETEEINRHKWIESEKAGRDLGDQAVLDWIEKYSDQFHVHIMRILKPPADAKVDTN
jgi:hypothetical protein